ncbi:tyrosine--tRNA ligase [Thermodesulfobacterium commune]|jgi:tyrosyl-tRNA synthetase|uniref:Tyrosine--tRNA ligase n=3 Tax=Thermodesulfobacterium commune TaxID=1741 RepID=A0A075WSU4_9BACT|nr:tyrosine--tRNA ligase [Thermodesulfobacterium commune]AIH03941.1 tyrosine--tRNA ligase [Thermodesulfobacterium commune DSM 2178]MDK2861459.1 tyrosyl-tRNA synthetase [Thermodesulfobacterium sp.]HCE80274.1 tyrosine--tRNA ligase [Thermodesulfobacterium commune]
MNEEIKRALELIKRGTVDLIEEEELIKKLEKSYKEGRPLRIKAGFDPTAPDLHLGHTVLLRKMKQFQDLGHEVYFLIGDFTAMIGDPTGRSETRPPLTKEQVLENAKTYKEQVFKILDPKKTKIVFNSQWLSKMTAEDMVRLCAKYTVARILEREDFKKRFESGLPISIHELIYPLFQAYDSVALEADVELGGTDQLFNLLIGRDIQREYGQEPQVILTLPILEGLDGVQKMSKSLGNYVGIMESPYEMFGKLMSIPDELMWKYYLLLTEFSEEEIDNMKASVEKGELHPKEVKKRLAKYIVTQFHSEEAALKAEEEFERVFSKKELPTEVPTVVIPAGKVWVPGLLKDQGLVKSNSEARRLIAQRAIDLNKEVLTQEELNLSTGEYVFRIGKKKFLKVIVN